MFDFLKIRQSIADLGAEVAKLRGNRETLLRRREDLESAPTCKADLLELLDGWIDRRSADFPQRLQVGVSYYCRHPLASLPKNPKAAVQPMRVLNAVINPDAMATIDTLEASLFYVLGKQIKQSLREAVETLDFTDAGPPRVQRIEEIAKIDGLIAEIDEQERELVEQAEKAGLRL